MDFYSKNNRCIFERRINIVSLFGLILFFFGSVLYFFNGVPSCLFAGVVGLILMVLRMIKWFDD